MRLLLSVLVCIFVHTVFIVGDLSSPLHRAEQNSHQPAVEPINIATIACNKHHSALLGGFIFSIIKSHATVLHRLHIFLVLDIHGQKQIESCLPVLRRIVQLSVINLEEIQMDELHAFHDSRFSCGFYKLNIHNILPQNVTLALFADIDTVINRNTTDLLQHHNKLITQGATPIMWAAMELADNQPCCPQCVKKHNWPSGGCGFNTGI